LKEVDDDLDKHVSRVEFDKMYKRCISDQSGLEPRKLYNLVVFLMYDKEFKGKVTVEDTLQLLYVRYGREALDEEIRAIFGENEKTEEGSEKFIEYREYIDKVNHRAMHERKQRKAAIKEYWAKKHGMPNPLDNSHI
jgi:Ca2+-binding EF-hand superfamily protein